MGCHQWNGNYNPSRLPKDSPPCGGWVRVAQDSVAVRLLVLSGRVGPEDLDDKLVDLFPDVQTMLRVNGIDVDALPPLRPPFPPEQDLLQKWIGSVIALRERLEKDPDLAYAYVLPGSPTSFGMDDSGNPRMPPRALAAWLKKCERWSADRSKSSTKEIRDA